MTRVTDESLKKCPPKLRALLNKNNNEYTKVAKLLNADRNYVGKMARGVQSISHDMNAKIEAALEDVPPPPKTRKHGGVRKPVKAIHPLLQALYDKYKSWTKAGQALGYSGAGLVYHWNAGITEFTEEQQQRVRDVLEGKVVERRVPKTRKQKAIDKGELGLAIVTVEANVLERLLDVAQSMAAISVFQKRLTPTSWLIIYRFTGELAHDDMMAFKQWAENGRAEVVTP